MIPTSIHSLAIHAYIGHVPPKSVRLQPDIRGPYDSGIGNPESNLWNSQSAVPKR